MYLCLAKGDHEDQPAKIVTSHEKQKSPHLQEKSASRPKGRVTYSVVWFCVFCGLISLKCEV